MDMRTGIHFLLIGSNYSCWEVENVTWGQGLNIGTLLNTAPLPLFSLQNNNKRLVSTKHNTQSMRFVATQINLIEIRNDKNTSVSYKYFEMVKLKIEYLVEGNKS